jgi:hypothetical protein
MAIGVSAPPRVGLPDTTFNEVDAILNVVRPVHLVPLIAADHANTAALSGHECG